MNKENIKSLSNILKKKIHNGEDIYDTIQNMVNIKYTANSLYQTIIFPEKSPPISWPTVNMPNVSCKQIADLPLQLKEANIKLFPGMLENSLTINEKIRTINKHLRFMKDTLIYACSIQIFADEIRAAISEDKSSNYEMIHKYAINQQKEKYIRIIYDRKNFIMEDDTTTQFLIKAVNLTRIIITTHICFVPHSIFNELFEPQMHNKNEHDFEELSYLMSTFKIM